jgi:sialic acid synthase SpsE
VALGASIIEKHFTLDRNGGGPDDSFSLEPSELFALFRDARTAWSALGKVDYECKFSEKENLKFRRSLYFIKNLKAGSCVDKDAVKSIRPGYGLSPKHIYEIVGRRLRTDVMFGSPVRWDQFY